MSLNTSVAASVNFSGRIGTIATTLGSLVALAALVQSMRIRKRGKAVAAAS